MRAMPGPVDDVFDVLEGTLDDLLRVRSEATDWLGGLVLASRMRQVRTAVAMLSALQRGGYDWRPADDGQDPAIWREIMLEVLGTHGDDGDYIAMVRRELDELVALTTPGPRRSLAHLGTFERLARRAGVPRAVCARSVRSAGDDMIQGWESCEHVSTLVRVSLILGTTLDELARQTVDLLLAATPSDATELSALLTIAREAPATLADHDARVLAIMRADNSDLGRAAGLLLHALARNVATSSRIEDVLGSAMKVITLEQLLAHLTTPALRARLVAQEAS